MNLCSDEFLEAFYLGPGFICTTCACGRVHFSEDDCWTNEAELLEYVAKAEADPDNYVMYGEGTTFSLIDLGAEYVYECPCGTAKSYEKWIWDHRDQIAKYLKARTATELREMQRQYDEIQAI